MALRRPKQGPAPYMRVGNTSLTNSTSFIEQHEGGFDYDLSNANYQQKARENLERRKTYKKGQQPESQEDYSNPYRFSEINRSPKRQGPSTSKSYANKYLNHSNTDRWDLTAGRIKIKDDNEEGRKAF